MKPFEWVEPRDLEEACALLSGHGEEAKIIAGGQSLLPVLRTGLVAARYLVNIKWLSELNYIKESPAGIRLGALTTHRTLETSALIKERLPILVEMEQQLASVQIRNWGTIGGSLCHADPAGDLAPCLIALEAKVRMRSVGESRETPLSEFFLDYLESTLRTGEIMTEITIPHPAPQTGGAFVKESVTAGSIAIVSAGAVVAQEGGRIRDTRIVFGAAGPTPIKARKAEEALLEGRSLEEVAAIAATEACPTDDVHGSAEYKRELVKAVTKSAVMKAIRRAEQCNK